MKYLKKFEAVIIPDSINDDSIVNSFESAIQFGLKNNFDVVDYDEFYNSLSEKNKKTAPPRLGIPFFALFNPNNKRVMFVLSDINVPRFIPNFKEIMLDIIGHEKVHSAQYNRRDIIYNLPNPTKKKEYFSNKDEIMAFSWTIANGLSKTNNNIKDAINDLNKKENHLDIKSEHKMLWNDIKKYCDVDIINRYNKYIYMYLDKIFNKKTNESFLGAAVIILSIIGVFKLFRWYLKFLKNNKEQRNFVSYLLKHLYFNSKVKYKKYDEKDKENIIFSDIPIKDFGKIQTIKNFGKIQTIKNDEIKSISEKDYVDALNINDFNDRWYVTIGGPFSSIPNFRILKKEKILILYAEKENSEKIQLTDSEYNEFVNIIKEKL